MDVTVVRSNRKTVAIQVKPDLSVTVRAPIHISRGEIDRILKEKEPWILRHIEMLREKKAEHEAGSVRPMSKEEFQELADQALGYIPERTAYFAGLAGVDYGRITIRNQRTRWGSCSSKGNLNFNCLLMLAPPEVIDYVIVHELCHRKELNHSKAFWNEVEKLLPDYREAARWLKEEGSRIMHTAFGN